MSQKPHSVFAIKAAKEITRCLREYAFHLDEVEPQNATIIDREAVQPATKELLEALKPFVLCWSSVDDYGFGCKWCTGDSVDNYRDFKHGEDCCVVTAQAAIAKAEAQ